MFGLFKNKKKNNQSPVIRIGDQVSRCVDIHGDPISTLDDGALIFSSSSLIQGSSVSITFLGDDSVDSVLYAVPPGDFIPRKDALRLMESITQDIDGKWEDGGNTMFGSESFYHSAGLVCYIDENSIGVNRE